MSDLNDDLLNYEIGDIEADGTELTGADEDELLLSDDESLACKVSQQQEDALLTDEASSKPSTSEIKSSKINEKEKSGHRITRSSSNVLKNENSSPNINDVVSSTNNEEDVDNMIQSSSETVSKSENEIVEVNSSAEHKQNEITNEVSSNNEKENTELAFEQSQETATSSQITSEGYDRSESNDFEADDSDDASERKHRNRKLCVEREQTNQSDDHHRGQSQHFQRNRGGQHFQNARHLGPRGHQSYRMGSPNNDNFGQPFMPQYGGLNRHPGNRPPFNRMPMQPMPQMVNSNRFPPQMGQQQMPGPPGPMPPHRMQRPMFFPNAGGPLQMNNNSNQFRPFVGNQVGAPRPPQQMPPFSQFQPQNTHPGNMIIHRTPMPPQGIQNQNMNPAFSGAAGPVLPVAAQLPSRKVLLNPNFKGGVQAATNQLMMDTLKNSMNKDAELLRQQEAFINQNRMHIEKRRRSRDYSPDRERSYSPPNRRRPTSRDREMRRPYNNRGEHPFRGNRMRRPGSRGPPHDNDPIKRRRSGSLSRENEDKDNQKTEEDEETRAYRLKIEKQKAMREKILRDKETRRRKAAEEIKNKDEQQPEKKSDDATAAQKLTPIIVTAKKIISLKKKSDSMNETKKKMPLERRIPTATVLPETKRTNVNASSSVTTAIVKPVMQKTVSIKPTKKIDDDIDEIDEDALLADSPPPASSPAKIARSKTLITTTASSTAGSGGGIFSNRRVVVRQSNDDTMKEIDKTPGQTTSPTQHKGIFDRLDKKVIGVNDASKRKIQRIVINNSE